MDDNGEKYVLRTVRLFLWCWATSQILYLRFHMISTTVNHLLTHTILVCPHMKPYCQTCSQQAFLATTILIPINFGSPYIGQYLEYPHYFTCTIIVIITKIRSNLRIYLHHSQSVEFRGVGSKINFTQWYVYMV